MKSYDIPTYLNSILDQSFFHQQHFRGKISKFTKNNTLKVLGTNIFCLHANYSHQIVKVLLYKKDINTSYRKIGEGLGRAHATVDCLEVTNRIYIIGKDSTDTDFIKLWILEKPWLCTYRLMPLKSFRENIKENKKKSAQTLNVIKCSKMPLWKGKVLGHQFRQNNKVIIDIILLTLFSIFVLRLILV